MPSAYSIYTREPVAPRQSQPRRTPTRWLLRTGATGLSVLLLIGLMIGWRSHRQSARRRQLMAQLQKEPDRARLREAVRSGQLTRDDARQVFASRMQSRLDAYFKLPPGPQRAQYLDKSIRELQNRRQQVNARRPQFGAAPPAPGNWSPGSSGAGPNPGSRAARMESIPPEQRAMMQQFRLDMQQRMRQLGIPSSR